MGAAEQAFELPLARELRNGAAHAWQVTPGCAYVVPSLGLVPFHDYLTPYIAEPVEGPVAAGADLWRKHLETNRGR